MSSSGAPRNGKVTVVGAGFYGSTTAQRLAEYDIFDQVVLTDIVEGKPEGLALDMNQSRPIEGFETLVVGATTDPATGAGYEKADRYRRAVGERVELVPRAERRGSREAPRSVEHLRDG